VADARCPRSRAAVGGRRGAGQDRTLLLSDRPRRDELRGDGKPAPSIVVVVKGYPRVSETFVAQELAALERRGFRLLIVSLRRPYDGLLHPVHTAIRAPVLYLPEYLVEAPGRVLAGHGRSLWRAPRRYVRSLVLWLADLVRDPSASRVRRFGQAGVLAAELPPGTRHLHAHFLHTPASVARYAAVMTGSGLSLSGHAKDVWTCRPWELREKLRAACFAVTCTAENHAYLARIAPGARITLVYHGLDRTLFAPPPSFGSHRDGSDPADPVRLLAVGRFQPKKGFDLLLDAVARVERHVTLTLVGYGPLEADLRTRARRLGLESRVRFTGPLDQPALLEVYRASDLFVTSPRIAPDGDRDGLPNVVVEALSQGLPVVASRIAAIPEIVEDEVNGLLVPPEEPAPLAAALERLVGDPGRRRRLGATALERLGDRWDVEAGADRLAALFDEALGLPAPRGARSPRTPVEADAARRT
jgi:glycosyltransferase involved in cell wall biosynthesis